MNKKFVYKVGSNKKVTVELIVMKFYGSELKKEKCWAFSTFA
jgi:hypothetical protein